jgi:hypothetical protein
MGIFWTAISLRNCQILGIQNLVLLCLVLILFQQNGISFPEQVAFDKVGVISSQSISKQRKKEELEVMAELELRVQRLNSGDQDPGSSVSQQVNFSS